MKTMTKRILSFILVLVTLTGLLAGCGGGPETPVTEATQAAVQTTPAATEAAMEPAVTEPAPVAEPASLPTYEGTPEVIRARRLGLIPESWQDDLSKEADFEGFDQMVQSFILLHNESYLEKWAEYVIADAYPDRMMRRDDGIILLFLMAEAIGYNYANYSSPKDLSFRDVYKEFSMDYPYFDIKKEGRYYGLGEKNIGGAKGDVPDTAFYFLLERADTDNELHFLDHDGKYNFHFNEPLTREAALTAMVRLYNSTDWQFTSVRPFNKAKYVALDDPAAVQPNGTVLTPELMEKAKQNPVVTAENHPRWTGFVLGDKGTYEAFAEEVAAVGEWGFNSVRYMLCYITLFNEDVTKVNLTTLRQLDQMVANAIKYDIHLNIAMAELPGRYDSIDGHYKQKGDFDLFVNEKKQEKTDRILRLLAARYKDIPNFNLSITPVWEPDNADRSTGLKAPEYTGEDIAAYLVRAIDVIRTECPDRLIIYEATGANEVVWLNQWVPPVRDVVGKIDNVMICYNVCERAFAGAVMTSEPDRNIDDMNMSQYVPTYPNYIYGILSRIEGDKKLVLDGVLPAGTKIDVYAWKTGAGTLTVAADGGIIHSEKLRDKNYPTGQRISGQYNFSTSKGKFSFTLKEDAQEVVLSCEKGFMNLSGVRVTLPEEYEQLRWFYRQPYDVYNGKEQKEGVVQKATSQILLCAGTREQSGRVTIREDLTYSTDNLQNSSSKETIYDWAEQISKLDGNCVLRLESLAMGGMIQSELEEHYDDLLGSYVEYAYSWWSNDWWLMTDEYAQTVKTAECESIEYAGYRHFNYDLLEALWKYRSKD